MHTIRKLQCVFLYFFLIRDTSLSNNISLWGLAVLLLSKTAGINAYSSSDIYDVKSGLYCFKSFFFYCNCFRLLRKIAWRFGLLKKKIYFRLQWLLTATQIKTCIESLNCYIKVKEVYKKFDCIYSAFLI